MGRLKIIWLILSFFAATALASPADLPKGQDFWRGEITSQEEMVQPVTIRFDDVGTMPDTAEMAKEFLLHGLKVTIVMFPDKFTEDAKQQLRDIRFWAERVYDPSQPITDKHRNIVFSDIPPKERVEFCSHTNTSMTPSMYGYSDSNEWPEFYKFTKEQWKAEFDKQKILDILRETGWADVTEDDIRGGVWPGDGGPTDRAWVYRNQPFLEDFLRNLGYDYWITGGTSSGDSLPSFGVNSLSGNPPVRDADARFGWLYNWPLPYALPMSSASDLLGSVVMERSPDIPWAPVGEESWTLAQNVPVPSAGSATNQASYATNWSETTKGVINKQLAQMHGVYFGFHSQSTTLNKTHSFAYPESLSGVPYLRNTNRKQAAIGTWFDIRWLAAQLEAYVRGGFIRPTLMSEHVHWLASKPAKPGLVVAGGKLEFPWLAVGDTVGVQPKLIPGFGYQLDLNPSTGNGVFPILIDDTDYDGDLLEHGYGTGASDVYWYEKSGGSYEGGAAMLKSNGGNQNSTILTAHLLPGKYRLEVVGYNVDQITATTHAYVGAVGYIESGSNGDYPEWDFVSASVDTLLTTGTQFDSIYPQQTEAWPGAAPTQLPSGARWWRWCLNFSIDPSTYSLPVSFKSSAITRYLVTFYMQFERASASSQPRVSRFQIRWMGDLD